MLMGTILNSSAGVSARLEEIAGNVMIRSLLAGDVDLDDDGVNELSLGIGFTAVGAKLVVA